VCFRTVSAWAGCVDPALLASKKAGLTVPIQSFAGEAIELVVLPPSAPFTRDGQVVLSFEGPPAPGSVTDVAVRSVDGSLGPALPAGDSTIVLPVLTAQTTLRLVSNADPAIPVPNLGAEAE
jgi:hypothetical protein